MKLINPDEIIFKNIHRRIDDKICRRIKINIDDSSRIIITNGLLNELEPIHNDISTNIIFNQ